MSGAAAASVAVQLLNQAARLPSSQKGHHKEMGTLGSDSCWWWWCGVEWSGVEWSGKGWVCVCVCGWVGGVGGVVVVVGGVRGERGEACLVLSQVH